MQFKSDIHIKPLAQCLVCNKGATSNPFYCPKRLTPDLFQSTDTNLAQVLRTSP